MTDLEKVQKTLSDVFDYLNGNNLQLVGKELLTEVGDAHRIVENLAIHDVVGRSEQVGCDNCADYKQGNDLDKYCLVCNRMVEL